ncbi:MAG: hypothetical protein Q9168_003362 [Polycauliona sp. 1 TL-2023]
MASPKKPSVSQLLDGLVTIKLEHSGMIFYIHKKLLCHHSPVFRAMLEHNWKEKQDGIVSLKNEDQDAFRRFVMWVYYGKILDDDETIKTISFQQLFHCYFLADRRDVPAMANYVIDALIRHAETDNVLPTWRQRHVWENTPEQSPLRRLLVDMLVLRGDIALILKAENDKNSYDKSFIVDVCIRKYMKPTLISWADFKKLRCDYHVHNERVPPSSSET